MKIGGVGGGSTVTGLQFEGKVDFLTAIGRIPGYTYIPKSKCIEIFFNGELVAKCFRKHNFYSLIEELGVSDWRSVISKKLLPDDALYVPSRRTVFIIEVKYQQVAGSVDEKLQTCHFKRRQYQRLLHGTGIQIEYVYVLNDWFGKREYGDVLNYIRDVGCHYYFEDLPLEFFGLPGGAG